jgi:hypothetical protein
MKIVNIICKVVFGLILVMPVLGTLGIFPPPTPDLYNTEIAYDFILMLMTVKYINIIMSVVCMMCIGLIVTNRMAFMALLILPITVNVVAFHAWIDGGLFTGGAVLGNIMLALNVYFIWQGRAQYTALIAKSN